MKCLLVIVAVVCLAGFVTAGAIKCTSASSDPVCSEKEIRVTEESVQSVWQPPTESLHWEAECQPGSEWDSRCHRCRCTSEGVADCAKQTDCQDTILGLEPIHCAPNTTFTRGCNTCVCLDSGLGLCTLKICKEAPIPVTSPAPPAEGKECLPQSTWKSQCNDCKCTADGRAVCTEKKCIGYEKESPKTCAPESAWKNECNSCWCTQDGRAMCTKMGCITGVIMNFGDDDNDSKAKSEANDRKQEKLDLDNYIYHNIVKRSPCKPNQSFQNDCNICKCSGDGLSYRCTQNECMDKEDGGVDKGVEVFMENEGVDHIERHSVCRPQATFYIGCNTCHCNFDGTDYTCTNKPCPLPEDVEVFHELKASKSNLKNKTVVCVANRMFIKDCNTCWCNEDGTGFFCTRKVCVLEQPEEGAPDENQPEALRILKRECRPDEVFELDCNMCRCNPDGKSFSCTRRACFSDPTIENVQEDVNDKESKNASLARKVRAIPPPETPKTCLPGQEFRMDCNKCLCDNLGTDFSCTRINCLDTQANGNVGSRRKREVSEQEVAKCEPGEVFDQGCNVCRCTSDGHHASCTLNRCSLKPEEEKKEDDSSNLTEGDPNFRCNPGEQFKRGCNDCTCSADGKSVFCTLRYCDKDLTPRL